MGNKNEKPQAKGKLGEKEMLIICSFFKTKSDYVNMALLNSKFQNVTKKLKYNPIPISNKKLFPNILNQFLFSTADPKLKGVKNYILNQKITYGEYINDVDDDIYCLFIKFDQNDIEEFGNEIPEECNCLGDYYPKDCESIKIPLSIKYLDEECFNGYTNLKTIILSDKIHTLPYKCFNECKSLRDINLEHVNVIGNSCFSNCSSLTAITLNKELYFIGKGSFFNCKKLTLIKTNGIKFLYQPIPYWLFKLLEKEEIHFEHIEYTIEDRSKYGNLIPPEVDIIGNGCFEGCKEIIEIEIPLNIKELGDECFAYCSDLKTVMLNSNIKEIPKGFMKYCCSLEMISLPPNITRIKEDGFKECIKLKEISMIENIICEKGSFSMCPLLSDCNLPPIAFEL